MKVKYILLMGLLLNTLTAFSQTLKVGDSFLGFSLKSTRDTNYDLSQQKNVKGFILVFMAPSCDYCILYEDKVAALNQKYKGMGYPVVAICPYGDDEVKYPFDAMNAMKKLAEEKHFTFPFVSDEQFKYSFLFGIKTTPRAVILQKTESGFTIKYIGKIDDEDNPKKTPKHKFVEDVLNKLL